LRPRREGVNTSTIIMMIIFWTPTRGYLLRILRVG